MPKVAVVTGASGGIGSAAARLLAKSGYAVVLGYLNGANEAERAADEMRAAGGEALCFGADLSRSKGADALIDFAVKSYGRIDLLAHCAGVSSSSLVIDTSDEEWRKIIDANLSSSFFCCRAALREMVRQQSGSIVLVSSIWGEVGASCEAAYSASKAGIAGLAKALAKEYAPSGITVNCVSPGFIDTKMNACLTDDEREKFLSGVPLGRTGTPDEVAGAILFLAESGYITGAVLPVNGGMN